MILSKVFLTLKRSSVQILPVLEVWGLSLQRMSFEGHELATVGTVLSEVYLPRGTWDWESAGSCLWPRDVKEVVVSEVSHPSPTAISLKPKPVSI